MYLHLNCFTGLAEPKIVLKNICLEYKKKLAKFYSIIWYAG